MAENILKIDWNNDLAEALIQAVRENEIIWNTSHSLYKNKTAKEAAWLRISSSIGLQGNPSYAKAKWRDLRDTYRKKLRALKPKSGDAGGNRKGCIWP